MTVADRFAELAIIRQLLLQRLQGNLSVQMAGFFDTMAREIETAMIGRSELSSAKARRVDASLRELKQVVANHIGLAESELMAELEGLGEVEARWTVQALNTAATISLTNTLPQDSVLRSIASRPLIQGAQIGDWMRKLDSDTQFAIDRTVRAGVALGRTNAELARDLIGVSSQGDKGPQPLKKARRDAMAIARTGTQTVANAARLETLRVNDDVVAAVQWLSTLDSRTSDICAARSGLVYDLEGKPKGHNIAFNGGPPAHWNCRSTLIPQTKTFRELGLDADELPIGTRASDFGQVAGDLSFADFLRGRPASFADEMLGKGRAQLWRDGKITLNQLLDQRGNPLTLAQLRARYADGSPAPVVKPAPKPKAAPKAVSKVERAAAIQRNAIAEADIPVVKKSAAKKAIEARTAQAAADDRYSKTMARYHGTKLADFGAAKFHAEMTDEAASMVAEIAKELDQMADLFAIPRLRGYKPTKVSNTSGTIASMGDGLMSLNPRFFTPYAARLGGKQADELINKLEAEYLDLREQYKVASKKYDELKKQYSALETYAERKAFAGTLDAAGSAANRIVDKITKLAARVDYAKQEIKPAVPWDAKASTAERPYNIASYFEGADKARVVMYHEFGHHVHQSTRANLLVPASRGGMPIEVELKEIFKTINKDVQPSQYATSNPYEWFAENFAAYMMNRREMVDPKATELIERLLNDA